MATEEKTTFGLSVVPPTGSSDKTLTPKPSKDSELSGTRTPASASDPANPFSAFYSHGSARRSREQARAAEKTPGITVYEADIEGQALTRPEPTASGLHGLHHPVHSQETVTPKLSVDGRAKECTMWPSRQTLQAEEKKRRRARNGCRPLRNLNSKQKLWAKILIGLFIVALAVGLGVGISRAVGGGVWSGRGQSRTIPKEGDRL